MNATAEMSGEGARAWRRGQCSGRGARWRPLELAAMIGGFILFWPIGLAVLALKIWQKRSGDQGDLAGFAMGRFEEARQQTSDLFRGEGRGWSQGGGDWGGSSGNRAFDDWRAAELARIEEERRKLDEARREFSEYRDHLRKAKDREEFDRFVRERDASKARGESGWKPFDDNARPQG